MKIAIAQINCTVGDLSGNAEKIITATIQAKNSGADLVITPELALCGYPPEDLLLRSEFILACQHTLDNLIDKVKDITLIVGHPQHTSNQLFNAASVIRNGHIIATHHKNKLINSPFFKETSYFDAGSEICTFELSGTKFGLNICADFWQSDVITSKQCGEIDVMLVLSASAYHINKQNTRHQITQQYIKKTGISVIHTNLVGGQDELVFDGASFVMDNKGVLTHEVSEFTETIGLVEIKNNIPITGKLVAAQPSIASIYQALCLGVKDYIHKNRFPGVIIGLSGGVDSALVLVIAVDALGADKVQTVMMPSQYTADISLQDASALADNLTVQHSDCCIATLYAQFQQLLDAELQVPAISEKTNATQENLQARIRGTLLMALSNQTGSMVLTTGNKSEMAVGYCTLYGDMAGGFAVLKDISKTLVYQLCHYRNQIDQVIPERILQRAPSAELRPDQIDQDSLPPYDVLDGIMQAYVEEHLSPDEIIALNYTEEDVQQVIHLIHLNEYKRRQAPLGIRITPNDFGKSWNYPVTAKYKDF